MQVNSFKTYNQPGFGCKICTAAQDCLTGSGLSEKIAEDVVNTAKEIIVSYPQSYYLYNTQSNAGKKAEVQDSVFDKDENPNFCERPEKQKIKELLDPIFDNSEYIFQQMLAKEDEKIEKEEFEEDGELVIKKDDIKEVLEPIFKGKRPQENIYFEYNPDVEFDEETGERIQRHRPKQTDAPVGKKVKVDPNVALAMNHCHSILAKELTDFGLEQHVADTVINDSICSSASKHPHLPAEERALGFLDTIFAKAPQTSLQIKRDCDFISQFEDPHTPKKKLIEQANDELKRQAYADYDDLEEYADYLNIN